jgi:hypothetical protein
VPARREQQAKQKTPEPSGLRGSFSAENEDPGSPGGRTTVVTAKRTQRGPIEAGRQRAQRKRARPATAP